MEQVKRKPHEYLTDPALALLKGGVSAGGAMLGLANAATGGWLNRGLQKISPSGYGFDPAIARDFLTSYQSEAQKRANAQVAGRQGMMNKARAALNNPSTIGNALLETAPTVASAAGVGQKMFGKALGRFGEVGFRSGPTKQWKDVHALLTGAAGEGVMGAGASAEQLRRERPEQTTFAIKDYGRMVADGMLNAVMGYAGGHVLQRLRLPEVDTAIANRAYAAEQAALSGRKTAGILTPEFGTGGNRGLAASTAGETFMENPAQQKVVEGFDTLVGGFLPHVREWVERKKKVGTEKTPP